MPYHSEQLEFLYKIQPTRPEMLVDGPTVDEERLVYDHFEYLCDLTRKGVVLLAGRTQNTDPTCFGIVIFRAADIAGARALMEADPAVHAGVFCAELYPFAIALAGVLPETKFG